MDKLDRQRVTEREWEFYMERYLEGDQDMGLGVVVSLMRKHVMELDRRIAMLEKKFKFRK